MSTPPPRPSAARWLLTTHHADADRVFYAHEEDNGLTTWTAMVRSGPASDEWTLKVHDVPQPGLFRVYTAIEQSVINCGGSDLTCAALAPTTPAAPARRAASA